MSDMTFDFDNLPPAHELETVINALDKDEVLMYINLGRRRVTEDPERVVPELENRALILLARRFRGMRETKPKAGTKTKATGFASLDDMLS